MLSKENEKKKKKSVIHVRIPKDATEERRVELKKIFSRISKDEALGMTLVKEAARLKKMTKRKLESIPDIKKLLTENLEIELTKPKYKGKEENLRASFSKKQRRCDMIVEKFDHLKRIVLNPRDDVFLSKIKPKKSLSGYMLFSKENRARIRTENPGATFGDLGRMVGGEWKALTEESKKQWGNRAKKEN
jgi:hypothetical protein